MTTTDYSKAYKAWANTRTVVVWLRRRAGDVQVEIANALRGSITRSAALLSNVELSGDEIVWNVPDDQLNPDGEGREIRNGDTIVESGLSAFDPALDDQKRWTVLSVQQAAFQTRWRCVCRRER